MRGQVGPSTKELKTVAEFEKFLANDEHSVVGKVFKYLFCYWECFMEICIMTNNAFTNNTLIITLVVS